jgi:DNA polymerase-3 subunit delta
MAAYSKQLPDLSEVMTDLQNGKLASLYFARGSDSFLYRQFLTKLKAVFKAQFGENAEFVQRWGVDLKFATDVSSLLDGGGLFSSASLIMLHEIQDAKAQVKTNLADILRNSAADTIVLVHYSVGDTRQAKWLTAIEKISQYVNLKSPEPVELPRLVSDMARRHALDLDNAAIYCLIEMSRTELAIIENELEKLALYLDDPKQTIGRDLIDQVAGAVENAQVSQFVEAFSNRDRQTAIQTLVEIHHRGKEGLPYLVTMLYSRLLQLMALKESVAARKSIGQGATSYYFLKQLQSAPSMYSLAELQVATRELAELDLQFRLGSLDLLVAFSTWVSKVV